MIYSPSLRTVFLLKHPQTADRPEPAWVFLARDPVKADRKPNALDYISTSVTRQRPTYTYYLQMLSMKHPSRGKK